MFAKPNKRKFVILSLTLIIAISLSACRNETQNRFRRSLQDFTASKMYITVYSIDGTPIFEGIVDGKVTRSSSSGSESGSYVYWYDDKSRYYQTNLSYLVSSYDRDKAP